MNFNIYSLTEDEIIGIANLALQEQGSIDGACAEMSLMANLYEQQTKYKSLYDFIRNCGWFSNAPYWMDNGNACKIYHTYAKYILCHGIRVLPPHINEHDCISDIVDISTGNKRIREDYKRDKTTIHNKYSSTYTFYCFPTSISDPFGYTKKGAAVSGLLANLIKHERMLAKIPYVETGNNHQEFSMIVNNVGLNGCQDQPWCCTYQFAMEVMEFGVERALMNWNMTRKNYCGYSCFETLNKFKEAGKVGFKPKLGALVVFKQSHIGRVLSINSAAQTFECGEGNTSNKEYDRNGDSCAVKTYFWNDPKIMGFCYIDYDDAAARDEMEGKAVFAFGEVKFNKDGKFSNDDYVLQTILRGRGFKGADGKELNLDGVAQENTMYAANAYMDARAKAGVDLGARDCWGARCWADVFGRKAIEA